MTYDNPMFGVPSAAGRDAAMFLSGGELLDLQLPAAKRNGYDIDAVRDVLAKAAHTIDSLYEQTWRSGEENNRLLADVEQLRSGAANGGAPTMGPVAESTRILAAADRTASELIAQAQAEAEIIRASAAQERTRTAAEVAEVKRLAQEEVARIEALAQARRGELDAQIIDAERRANERVVEIDRETQEVARRAQQHRERIDTEVEQYQGAAELVRGELERQLEEFRLAAERERQQAINAVMVAARTLQAYQPTDMAEAPDLEAPPMQWGAEGMHFDAAREAEAVAASTPVAAEGDWLASSGVNELTAEPERPALEAGTDEGTEESIDEPISEWVAVTPESEDTTSSWEWPVAGAPVDEPPATVDAEVEDPEMPSTEAPGIVAADELAEVTELEASATDEETAPADPWAQLFDTTPAAVKPVSEAWPAPSGEPMASSEDEESAPTAWAAPTSEPVVPSTEEGDAAVWPAPTGEPMVSSEDEESAPTAWAAPTGEPVVPSTEEESTPTAWPAPAGAPYQMPTYPVPEEGYRQVSSYELPGAVPEDGE